MGLSSSKTTTVSKPSDQQVRAGNTLDTTFQQQLPRIQAVSDQIGSLIPGLMSRFNAGDPGINAARGYITDTLSGDGTNPFMDDMINQSGLDAARGINATLGTRGNIGGSVQQRILANELSRNALGMRYNDWNQGQQRKMQAAGMAPGMAASDMASIAPLLGVAEFATGRPLAATSQYASGMGGLFGNTGSQTTTQSPSIGGMLLNGIANAATSYFGAKPSDVRLKEDIRRVGQTDGGLPVYTYRYKGEDTVHMGVMAQDVAEMQPEALGPIIHGEFMTVQYGEVR